MRISDWSSDVCSSDLAILFADQRRIVELLALGIAPQLGADVLVQPLGERLGKAVGDRFQEDTRIIVMIGAEAGQMRLDPVPGGHREAAEIGRASCRERECQYVYISVGAVSLKKKKTNRH